MDYLNMTAPCGLDCFNCPLYKANKDETLRKKLMENLNVPYERAVCQGCRNENGKIPYLNMTETCKTYECVNEKGHDFCYECSDFPCDYLHPLADYSKTKPHNLKVFNLCLIKKMGLENWAENKAKDVMRTYYKKKWEL
jgi:hypothetical protein